MADSKSVQEAESAARAAAGIDPALNVQATQVVDDGPRGDPQGDNQPRQQTEPPAPERAPLPVKGKSDDRRAEINARFRADRNAATEELADEISEFNRSGMPPEWEQPQDPAQAAAPADPAADPQAAPADTGELRFKVKINGVEREITLEEMTAHAQRSLAAENLVDAAKAQFKEIESLAAQARDRAARVGPQQAEHQRQPQPNAQNADPQQPAADPAPEHHEDGVAKLIETLQFGDPAEAAQRLRNTIGELVQQGVSQGVKQTLQGERLKDEGARSAKILEDFKAKNPTLANDPMASAAIEAAVLEQQIADIQALGVDLNQLRPDGLAPTPGDIAVAHRWYRTEGHRVSSVDTMLSNATNKFLAWKGQSPNPTADPAPAPLDRAEPRIEVSVERQARRQAAPQQPSQSSAPPRPAAQQQVPQTRDRSAIVQAEIARRNKPRGRVGVIG